MGLLVAKQQRKPVCVTDHGGFSSTLGLKLGQPGAGRPDRRLLRLRRLASTGPAAPIVVIKGGVDGALFTPPRRVRPRPRPRPLRRPAAARTRGSTRLIAALPAELPLTVCGRPYHADYFDRLQALAAGKTVEFVTDADDATIRDLYRRAWANVLPSVYRDCYGSTYAAPELMGFTLLEAMACGTPAICLAGRRRCPSSSATARPASSSTTRDELTERLAPLAGDPRAGRADGRGRPAQVVERGVRPDGRRRAAARRLPRALVATRAGGGRVKILVLSNLYPPDVIGGYELGCRQVVEALRRPGPRRPGPDRRARARPVAARAPRPPDASS